MNESIRNFMTPVVKTIGIKSSLVDARAMMEQHGIRHLPVKEGGTVVGLVSQRDLAMFEGMRQVDVKGTSVEDAMAQDVLTVDPDDPLSAVAAKMAARKYGSAVVARKGQVLGIFTTVDALRVIERLFATEEVKRALATLDQ